VCTDSLHRRLHGCASRQPVVDEQDDAISQLDRRSTFSVRAFPSLELGLLVARDLVNDAVWDPVPGHDVRAQNTDTA
jgi:hypothetical protein